MKRKIGLYFRVGIEMGNFILSGMANKLQEKGFEVVILTSQKNHFFEEMLQRYGLKKIDIINLDLDIQTRSQIEGYFLSSRRARLRLNGYQTFAYWNETAKKRFKDYLIGNRLVYEIFRLLSFNAINKHYINEKVISFFEQEKFTDIFLQTYAMPQNMSLAINAKNNGLNVWLMNWGWKDFYINEWIPFKPKCFFVWSEKYKNLYLRYNTHLVSEDILIVGNPNFDSHFNYMPKYSKEYYEAKYSFGSHKKLFIYAMIHPDAYADENLIIEKLVKYLSENLPDIHLLLKPNPMDKNLERYNTLLLENKNVSMMENLWNFDKENDFNLITQEAKTEWLDMIYYSYGMLTIPSTVTIESLILRKPVISIGYGAKESDNRKILRFANAEFYKPLFERSDVLLSTKLDETISYILDVIDDKIVSNEDLNEFILDAGNATELVVDRVIKG
jgi:hypothetical protein